MEAMRRPTPILPTLVLLLAVSGCKRPDDAPEDLDALCAYLFAHHPDDDPDALVAGLVELEEWFEISWVDGEGYVINPLSEQAVDQVDEVDRSAVDMTGVAVGTVSSHDLDDAVRAWAATDQDVVYPKMFSWYEREYVGDVDCFMDRDCLRLEAEERYESKFALGLKTEVHGYNQYRWVELDRGWGMVHRFWMMEPPNANSQFLEVDEQFYMNVVVPAQGGGHWRMQSMWIIYTQDSVPDSIAYNLTVNDLYDNSGELDDYLESLDD